ncbi:hypothetical protein BB558_004577 [Smittium angustum]|uniref:C2H2-type domain-containing protein n=1 Tax=Smittium angustum TaxID=133377 RepID=A0A2U1J2T6_SMIAN|nr:hypothetical protein BB558_004577 [Smittium angustum]
MNSPLPKTTPFSSKTMLPAETTDLIQLPSTTDSYDDEFFYTKDVEDNFFCNFSCCGLVLADLHDLLQHYEESHVKFENDDSAINSCSSDTKFFNNSWSKTNAGYNLGVDVPVSFTLSSAPEMLDFTHPMLNNISPSKINISQVPSDIAFNDDISNDSDVTRTNSCTDLNEFNDLCSKLGTKLSDPGFNFSKNAFNKKRFRENDDFLSVSSAYTSATVSAQNSPPLSPSLNTAISSISNSPGNSYFDFFNQTNSFQCSAEIDNMYEELSQHNLIESNFGGFAVDGAKLKKKYKSDSTNSSLQNNVESASNNINPLELSFGSSALSLYDDDIISALANSTDPLFLVKDASLTSSHQRKALQKQKSDSDESIRALKDSININLSSLNDSLFNGNLQDKNKSMKKLNDSFPSKQTSKPNGLQKPKKSQSSRVVKSNGYIVNLPASISAAMADAVTNEANRVRNRSFNGKPNGRDDKPYKCVVNGCDKAYKNPNGLKYHTTHGHCDDDVSSSLKPYRCLVPNCLRAYKNLNGLKYHIIHSHNISDNENGSETANEEDMQNSDNDHSRSANIPQSHSTFSLYSSSISDEGEDMEGMDQDDYEFSVCNLFGSEKLAMM